MSTRCRAYLPFLASLCLAALIVFEGRALGESAARGLRTVLLVLPSVFPSLVLSGLIARAGAESGEKRKNSRARRLFTRLFRLPASVLPALLLSLIAGFPTGAKGAAALYAQGKLTREEAERLSSFTNFCAPTFLVVTVGLGVFKSASVGWAFYGFQTLFALLFALATRPGKPKRKEKAAPPARPQRPPARKENPPARPKNLLSLLSEAISEGALQALKISGFILFFSILSGLLYALLTSESGAFARLLAPVRAVIERGGCLFFGFFELSSGVSQLDASYPHALLFASLILGFSGVSVLMQCAAFLQEQGLSARRTVAAHLLLALLAAAAALAVGM